MLTALLIDVVLNIRLWENIKGKIFLRLLT